MIFMNKQHIIGLALVCSVSSLWGYKETQTFAYAAGSQCAADMVTNLVYLAQSPVKEPICIEEFVDRYSCSFTFDQYGQFLKGFYQQLRTIDIHWYAQRASSDKFVSRLLSKGHTILVELLPYIIEHGSTWTINVEDPTLSGYLEQAIMTAANIKYGVGSKRYNDIEYIVRTLWRNY